jgi:hypothetical protein
VRCGTVEDSAGFSLVLADARAYSFPMTLGAVFLGLMAAGGITRVIFLNSEIRALKAPMKKFLAIAQSSPDTSAQSATEIEEAATEYEWIKNTRDLKKEARLVWVTGTIIILFVLFLSVYF